VTQPLVDPDDIERAAERIGGLVRRTPVIEHDLPGVPSPLVLKLELLQHAGSFKPRGAANRVRRAVDEGLVPAAGLITASGGNHGAAVSYVASALRLRAEVYMPSSSPAVKKANIERFGAAVTVIDGFYDDAQRAADDRRRETGALMVHPFDHVDTVAGQGTMSREIEAQAAGIDTIVVASGGGGFTAGQAAWWRDRVKVVSVEPETSQCLRAALAAGAPVDVQVAGLAADALGARRIGDVPWSIVASFVDDAVVVSDEDIRRAQHELWQAFRLVVEPGGAAAYAALRCGAYVPERHERVAVIVCGSNCDPLTVQSPTL
jgi:threonine dehydratase